METRDVRSEKNFPHLLFGVILNSAFTSYSFQKCPQCITVYQGHTYNILVSLIFF